jgi:alkanesulfonate monooxygenase SsuD/methylene tetrahydromethanopterin reductase-like flavin-dependent oxidoreductase (luciferase family)
VGGGWNLEELRNHGTDPSRRFGLLRQRVEAIREIWTKDEAEYHGELVDFGPIWSWPKPVQEHLPILVGGNAENTLKRALAYGDGWIPNGRRSQLLVQIPEFHRLCEESGRGRLPVTVYGSRRTQEGVEEYRELGVDRLVFWMPSAPYDEVMPVLEEVTALAQAR